jgi:hypothetical protein
MELSEEQIAFIRSDLQQRGIVDFNLETDLLDHLCCMVEARPEESFDNAYREVLKTFGEHEFVSIQRETEQLIVLTKNKTMTTTLRISGIGAAFFLLVGSLFKVMHWPGAGASFILGAFLLVVLFLPITFIMRYKTADTGNRSMLLNIIGAACGIFLAGGITFKMFHWPMASIMYYTGIALLLFGYVPVYVISVYKNSLNKVNAFSTVILIIAVSGILFLANNANSERVNQEYRNALMTEQQQAQTLQLRVQQLAQQDSVRKTQLEQVLQNCAVIRAAEEKIVLALEGTAAGQPAIGNMGNRSVPMEILNGNGPTSFTAVSQAAAASGITLKQEDWIGLPSGILLQKMAQLRTEMLIKSI